MKKYFLFSDVHGELSALLSSLDKAGFKDEKQDHILICLGDSFDRGNENAQMLEFLYKYEKQNRLMMVFGNHDRMLLQFMLDKDSMFNIMHNGLDRTILNLSGLNPFDHIMTRQNLLIEKIKEKYPYLLEFLDKYSMVDKIELGNYVLTHGGYSPLNIYDKESEWTPDNWAHSERFVERFHETKEYDPDKIYVFGHWHARKLNSKFNSVNNDYTFIYKNYIGIDACTNLSDFVNIIVLEEDNHGRITQTII
jgi:serine/threonine protein phosphatase 1